MNYINRFSATEKVIFGLLVVIATVTALAMADGINSFFMIEIPSNNGKLTEGLVGLPHTINPILAVTDVDRDISALVYSGLTTYKDGAFIPDLAASSTISSDGLTYSFTLKSGLHFQDGTPLTTDDVAYTIQKIQDAALKSPLRADWKDVTVKVISRCIAAVILTLLILCGVIFLRWFVPIVLRTCTSTSRCLWPVFACSCTKQDLRSTPVVLPRFDGN